MKAEKQASRFKQINRRNQELFDAYKTKKKNSGKKYQRQKFESVGNR